MSEFNELNKDYIIKGFEYLNQEIKNDSSIKDDLWKTVEYLVTRKHHIERPLSEYLDEIYAPPIGYAIETLLTGTIEKLEDYVVENVSFYKAMKVSFEFYYAAFMRSFSTSPSALLYMENINNSELFRFIKADQSFVDIELDVVALSHVNTVTLNELFSTYFNPDTDEELKGNLKVFFENMHKYISENVL